VILRAALAVGLVWLMVPHQPDLGLPDDPRRASSAAAADESVRAAILQRLREVRAELEDAKLSQTNPLVSTGREAALQNAGRLPESPISRPNVPGAQASR
jgi:hypothetical protein